MTKLDYESALVLISVSIMLSDKESVKIISKKHKDLVLEDKLLNALSLFAEKDIVAWNGKFKILKVFEGLEDICHSCNKEEVLLNYLFKWYSNHKEASWYESDKENNNTYVGYWSFESAALAKIFSVSEDKLKQNIFYPTI